MINVFDFQFLPPLPSSLSSPPSSLVELSELAPSGDKAVQFDHSDVFHSGYRVIKGELDMLKNMMKNFEL